MRALRQGLGIVIGVCASLWMFDCTFAALSGSLEESQIIVRLQPEAQIQVQQGGAPVDPAMAAAPIAMADIGRHRYEETCHICHGSGLAGAPKLADRSDWAPRIAEGIEVLVQRAIQGYKAMPPKGSCMNCSDEEIRKAVEYMVSKAQ